MKVYAAADIHGRAAKLEAIRERVAAHRPDVLVVAGDVTRLGKVAPVLKKLDEMGVPVLMVRGNSDSRKVDLRLDRYSNLHSLHLKIVERGGVPFVGAGGTAPIPFRSKIRLREKGIVASLAAMVNGASVVVVHPPPLGVLDEALGRFHAGSGGVAALIEKRGPRLLICGHIHERAGVATVGNTVVVNSAMSRSCKGAVIHLDGNEPPEVEMV